MPLRMDGQEVKPRRKAAESMLDQQASREPFKAPSFLPVHALQWIAPGVAQRLDLGDHQRSSVGVQRYQIRLDACESHVAPDDRIPASEQVAPRRPFAARTEGQPGEKGAEHCG